MRTTRSRVYERQEDSRRSEVLGRAGHRPSAPRGRRYAAASLHGAARDDRRTACDARDISHSESSSALICTARSSSVSPRPRSGYAADVWGRRQRVTAERGRNASSPRAVTRGASGRIDPIILALRPANHESAPCRSNDAFPQYRFYPLRLRQSRAPCLAPLAHTQMSLSATTQPGRPTHFAVCRTALPFQSTQEENHRPSNLQYQCRRAEQTAYRLAPARALVAHRFNLYLASMSHPRSSVLVTPQLTTVSRVDLNTYPFVLPSSKQSRTGRCRH